MDKKNLWMTSASPPAFRQNNVTLEAFASLVRGLYLISMTRYDVLSLLFKLLNSIFIFKYIEFSSLLISFEHWNFYFYFSTYFFDNITLCINLPNVTLSNMSHLAYIALFGEPDGVTFIKVRVYSKALVSTSADTWHSSGPTSAYERWSFDMGDRPALWPHPSRHVSHGGDVVPETEDTSPKARRGPPARPPAAALSSPLPVAFCTLLFFLTSQAAPSLFCHVGKGVAVTFHRAGEGGCRTNLLHSLVLLLYLLPESLHVTNSIVPSPVPNPPSFEESEDASLAGKVKRSLQLPTWRTGFLPMLNSCIIRRVRCMGTS